MVSQCSPFVNHGRRGAAGALGNLHKDQGARRRDLRCASHADPTARGGVRGRSPLRGRSVRPGRVHVADLKPQRSRDGGVPLAACRGRRVRSATVRRRTRCPRRTHGRWRARRRRGRSPPNAHSPPAGKHRLARISMSATFPPTVRVTATRRSARSRRGLADTAFDALPVRFAQFPFQQFAARVAGQFVGEVDGLGQLESGQPVPGERDQVRRTGRAAGRRARRRP